MSEPKEVNISEIPEGMRIEDYPDDTIFVWDEYEPLAEEQFWNEDE